MDERTPEYDWLPVAAPTPPAEPEPEQAAAPSRPVWAPAIWEPAAPAEELPAEPEADPTPDPGPKPEPAPAKTPLLKRELSFRRKPKVEQPAPAREEAPTEELPATSRAERAEAAATSLLKKEISFRRRRKAPKAETESTSLLRKELSFRRKPKAAKTEQPEKTSLLRKELSFRRKPKAAKTEQPEKTSLLKKELSFRRKPKPRTEKGARTPLLKRELFLGRKPKQPKPAKTQAPVTAKKLVGLKIGASQLAAARVVNNGSAQVTQLARTPLEPGIVVGGELRDPDRLADALRRFFSQHKLPKRGVRLGLASNRIGVRVFELEGIDDPKQLANAIRFRAQEALPIPVDEAVLDYQVLEERVVDGRPVRRVLLVVAYRELIDRYVAACRKAGIQLVGIDLEAFALLRALSAQQADAAPAEPAALVAVSIGSDRSTFAVSDGTTCEFTRVLEWGGASLDVALARALNLSPSEAEPIKRAVGLEGDAAADLPADQLVTAREALRGEVQAFARELVSSLQFYQNQPGSLGIAEIVVTGGTAHLVGLAEQLHRLIGVRVRVGDPLEHVRPAKKLKDDGQLGSMTVAIGLGVER